MSNEIWHHYETGNYLYARIRRTSDNKVYDAVAAGNTFDTWADADVADYKYNLADRDGNFYSVDFPSTVSAGTYIIGIFLWDGIAALTTDVEIAQGIICWDGSAEISPASLDTLIDTVDTVVDGIQTDLDNATDGLGALKVLIDVNQTDLDAIIVDTTSIETKIDTVDGVVDAILVHTGTDGVLIADDAISSDTYDETSAWPLAAADAAATQIARVGAHGDTLETLSDQLDGITTDQSITTNVYNDQQTTIVKYEEI